MSVHSFLGSISRLAGRAGASSADVRGSLRPAKMAAALWSAERSIGISRMAQRSGRQGNARCDGVPARKERDGLKSVHAVATPYD